jgi:hypothetical protein
VEAARRRHGDIYLISPYSVAGFALRGKWIIAYDDSRLFALPVEAIQTPENDILKRGDQSE